MSGKEQIDVLVICALKDEFEQVLQIEHGICSSGWEQKALDRGWLVADARFLGKDNAEISVRVTWSAYMGREEAGALVHSMLSEADFKCIAMTGICAGRRGKVSLGDVIFAERLWSYDAGKLVKEGEQEVFQGDMLQYRPGTEIVQRMQNLAVDSSAWPIPRPKYPLENQENWVLQCLANQIKPFEHDEFDYKCSDWQAVLARLIKKKLVAKELTLTDIGHEKVDELNLWYPKGLPDPEPFKIHVAPIATGAAVIEDEDLFSRLSHSMRKVLGVDMEASALGAVGSINRIPVIVAKAVSDFGDTFKDDQYRHFAAQASAQCMLKFIRDNADLFVNQAKSEQVNLSNEELIGFLAEEYPDIADARAVWKRAGGCNSDIASNSRPKDMWLNIWQKSVNGAVVTPTNLLNAVACDYPENELIKCFLTHLSVNGKLS
ncbi:5'-methylthioadenosine/S-adenosylhomocysteine nucleosidase family protein [Shewanella seohaensis]|uniref:Nucleoside phosphorylase domain-containing protein n=1 Tax=Shewanella seohaensis TaxID=755175 RepID=A0ABV4VX52_9GAMM